MGTELAIIKVIEHPNIVELIDVYEDEDKIYIMLELMKGGELFDYIIQKLIVSEFETALVVYQLLSTLFYLHECGIVHRDLKPENVLIEMESLEDRIKKVMITDFGLSKMMSPKELVYDMCGTLSYVAPEVLA